MFLERQHLVPPDGLLFTECTSRGFSVDAMLRRPCLASMACWVTCLDFFPKGPAAVNIEAREGQQQGTGAQKTSLKSKCAVTQAKLGLPRCWFLFQFGCHFRCHVLSHRSRSREFLPFREHPSSCTFSATLAEESHLSCAVGQVLFQCPRLKSSSTA